MSIVQGYQSQRVVLKCDDNVLIAIALKEDSEVSNSYIPKVIRQVSDLLDLALPPRHRQRDGLLISLQQEQFPIIIILNALMNGCNVPHMIRTAHNLVRISHQEVSLKHFVLKLADKNNNGCLVHLAVPMRVVRRVLRPTQVIRAVGLELCACQQAWCRERRGLWMVPLTTSAHSLVIALLNCAEK